MDCFNPQTIRLPDGTPQVVRCNKCLACLAYRQGGWIVRLRQEMTDSDGAFFVTLTYDDEHLPYFQPLDFFGHPEGDPIPSVRKKDVQSFFMDLRKRFQQGFYIDDTLVPFGGKPKRISLPSNLHFKYYLTSELGPHGNRPHYHAIIFHFPQDPYLAENLVRHCWHRGFVMVLPAQSAAAAAYVTKYLINDSFVQCHPQAPRMFSLMSKGLGKSYLDSSLVDWHRADPRGRCFHPRGSEREILPRYWKDKIFDDSMKADLLDISLEREAAKKEYLEILSPDERLAVEFEEVNRQSEAVRQARWRFEKSQKVK